MTRSWYKLALPAVVSLLLLLLVAPTAVAGDPMFGMDGDADAWPALSYYNVYPPDWNPPKARYNDPADGLLGAWYGFFENDFQDESGLLSNVDGPLTNGFWGGPATNAKTDIHVLGPGTGNTRCNEGTDADLLEFDSNSNGIVDDSEYQRIFDTETCENLGGGFQNKNTYDIDNPGIAHMPDVDNNGLIECSSGNEDPYCTPAHYSGSGDYLYINDGTQFDDFVKDNPDDIYVIGDEFDWMGRMDVHPKVAAYYFADLHARIEDDVDIAKGTSSSTADAKVYYTDLGNNLRYYDCSDFDPATLTWQNGSERRFCSMLSQVAYNEFNLHPVEIEPGTSNQGRVLYGKTWQYCETINGIEYCNGNYVGDTTNFTDPRSKWNLDNFDYWYLVAKYYSQARSVYGTWLKPTGFTLGWGAQPRTWYYVWDTTGGNDDPFTAYIDPRMGEGGRQGWVMTAAKNIPPSKNFRAWVDYDRDGVTATWQDYDGDGIRDWSNELTFTDSGDYIPHADDDPATHYPFASRVTWYAINGESVTPWGGFTWNALMRYMVTGFQFNVDWFARNATLWGYGSQTPQLGQWGAGGYIPWFDASDINNDGYEEEPRADCYPGNDDQVDANLFDAGYDYNHNGNNYDDGDETFYGHISEHPRWPANPFGRYDGIDGSVADAGAINTDWTQAGYVKCDLGLGAGGQARTWPSLDFNIIVMSGANAPLALGVHNLPAGATEDENDGPPPPSVPIRNQGYPDFQASEQIFASALLEQLMTHWFYQNGVPKWGMQYFINRNFWNHIEKGEDPHGPTYECGGTPMYDLRTGGVQTPRAKVYNQTVSGPADSTKWQWWMSGTWSPWTGQCFVAKPWPDRFDDQDDRDNNGDNNDWGDLPPGW